MANLDKIEQTIKIGDEPLICQNNRLPITIKDFWAWSASDIMSNATRSRFAEFIVATANNVDLGIPRQEWEPYDLLTPEGIKIEVKSSAYIQSWHQKQISTITFSIKPARYWNSKNGEQESIAKRHTDIYVMCLLKNMNQNTINPLDMDQWDFYVLSRPELDNYKRSQHSITLKSLENLTQPVTYAGLHEEIKIKHRNHQQSTTA
jgi:hypothetical protein